MSLEAKKINLIERFMRLKQEHSILKLESVIAELEMNARADSSKEDIEYGQARSYDDFSKEVKKWLKNKTTN